jgi:arylformamidase
MSSTKTLSRRRMFQAASAIGSYGIARSQQRAPGPPPHEHGPKVFMDYDQVELDAAYDQASYAFNARQVGEREAANSELTRKRLGAPQRVSYGQSEVQKLDIFRTAAVNAPVHVFIHGGAWRNGEAKNSAYLAEPFVKAGAHFVIPDFAGVQNFDGRLNAMEAQIREAMAWVYKNAKTFGGDPNRVYLSGHSSGGHLAASALITDWQREYGTPADTIKGAVIVSGLFELKPVSLSARREYVKFDEATLDGLSAQRHLDKLNMPLVVAHASLDTPEFQRQSREFAAALKAAGKRVEFLVGQGYNHFEFIETLANPYGILGAAALAQMGLAKS